MRYYIGGKIDDPGVPRFFYVCQNFRMNKVYVRRAGAPSYLGGHGISDGVG